VVEPTPGTPGIPGDCGMSEGARNGSTVVCLHSVR
jgi:hypothetical protein